MTDNRTDRFGFSEDYLAKVNKDHNSSGAIRAGCYVPSEKEVETAPAKELTDILIDWFWESPVELIPTNEQVEAVKTILLSRSDQQDIKKAIAECDDYLKT